MQHVDSEGTVFRANHASNYLTLKGTLNGDREALLAQIRAALEGRRDLKPEFCGRCEKSLDICGKGATMASYSKPLSKRSTRTGTFQRAAHWWERGSGMYGEWPYEGGEKA